MQSRHTLRDKYAADLSAARDDMARAYESRLVASADTVASLRAALAREQDARAALEEDMKQVTSGLGFIMWGCVWICVWVCRIPYALCEAG